MFDNLELFVNGLEAPKCGFQKVGFVTYVDLVITKIFKFDFWRPEGVPRVQKYFSHTPYIFYEGYVLIFAYE